MANELIFLLEDDRVLRENFAEMLRSEGYRVGAAASVAEARTLLAEIQPDLALLDIALPDDREGGFAVCRQLRAASDTLPIVFLTSHAREADRISALRLGADDYIVKEVSLDYLLVRIHALFQRLQALRSAMHEDRAEQTGLHIDDRSLVAFWQGQQLDLTLTEFWLLRALASDAGKVWTTADLMTAARQTVEPNTVVAQVTSIRRKIRLLDPDFSCIHTERGIGYRWVC